MSDVDQATRQRVVYQLDTSTSSKPWLSDLDARRPLIEFLHAHGLRYRFIMGTTIYVREHEDGTLWLHTRRATGELPSGAEMCPHCEHCVKTEPVRVPLVAPVPYTENLGMFLCVDYLARLTTAGPS